MLLLLLVAGVVWFSLKVELGGRTLWERVLDLASGSDAAGIEDGSGPPMEEISDQERKALDRLLQEESARPPR